MDEFIGKDETFVKDRHVRQGLEKPPKNLSMFLKVRFLNFRYFFITCKHINISDKVNYVLFITVKTITDVNTA